MRIIDAHSFQKTIREYRNDYPNSPTRQSVCNIFLSMLGDENQTPTITDDDLLAKIAELEAELKEERHRHDRYVDFELDEAKELHELREKNRWIPVTERLPTEDDADPDNGVLAIHMGSKKRYYHWRSVADNPFDFTHWMPLPESPEEDSQ